MKRLVSLVVVFTLLPVSAAWATELDELLEQSREAAYTAEQIISCSTPDGVRAAVVRIAQSSGEIRMTSTVAEQRGDPDDVNGCRGHRSVFRRRGLDSVSSRWSHLLCIGRLRVDGTR